MDKYVKNHNYGYGSSEVECTDKTINKLYLRNTRDLKIYLKELITSQDINAKVINNKIKKEGFSDIKLQIKKV